MVSYFKENDLAKSLGYNNDKRQVGVQAQEVESVLPEIVTEAPINDKYKTIYYDKLVPLLIEGIEALTEKVNQLENKIDNLKINTIIIMATPIKVGNNFPLTMSYLNNI